MLFKISNPAGKLKDLKLACILDELSTYFFSYECMCLDLEPENWLEQLTKFKPDMLFVESAWKGKQDKWYKKIAGVAPELLCIVNWCRKRAIPTVFWNKEDPIHMSTFLHAASFFDFVYTTDLDCVPLYKRLLKHERVDVLPFASPVHMFNPIEKYERKRAACFAGSYYTKQLERKEDFDKLVQFLEASGWPLEIYDRNPYPGNPEYTFPDKYRKFIVGTGLPVTKIDVAYKGYELAITMNIVKHSSTMEARRAFELLSSNALVISNPCLGLKNLFGDIILFLEGDCGERLAALGASETLGRKIRLQGLRKVLSEHTYRHRLEHIYRDAYGHRSGDKEPEVCVYSLVRDRSEFERVLKNFDRQRFQAKRMVLFTDLDGIGPANRADIVVKSLQALKSSSIRDSSDTDFFAFFHSGNYYGANYLLDFAAATEYETVSVFGKGKYYAAAGGSPALRDTGTGEYAYCTHMLLDRCMTSGPVAAVLGYAEIAAESYAIDGFPCLATDCFNFCEGYDGPSCDAADDIEIEPGIAMEELYRISRELRGESYYRYDRLISADEVWKNAKTTGAAKIIRQFADGSLGIATRSETGRNVVASKTYDLPAGRPDAGIGIYLDAISVGCIKYYIEFIPDGNKKQAKNGGQGYSFLIPEKSFTNVRIPDGVAGFRIAVRTAGKAAGKFKEVLINPECRFPIDLDQFSRR